jgi:hypothetical protein
MEIWLGLAFVALASQAALAVDLNGPWRLEVYVTRLALTFDDVCALTVSQTGSVFAATGSCSGAAQPVSLQGTVDPDTGALSGSGTIGACAAIVFSGSVASTAASVQRRVPVLERRRVRRHPRASLRQRTDRRRRGL